MDRDQLVHLFADGINPGLALLVAGAPFLGPHPVRPWQYWVACSVSIGVPVVLAELGKMFVVWPGHPSFPSGHETFALACTTCLAYRDLRWLWPTVPLCLLLGVSLVLCRYHVPVDTVGALFLGPPIAALFQHLHYQRVSPPSES